MGGKMDYKLVLCDLDGTLLNREKNLLPSTANTVHDLVKSGVLFAIVSARTISYAESAISTIQDLCCAAAYVNGGYIVASNGDVIKDSPIERRDVSALVEKLDSIHASICLISKDDAIAKLAFPEAEIGFKLHHGRITEKAVIDGTELDTYMLAAEAKDMTPFLEFAKEHVPNIVIGPIMRVKKTGIEVAHMQSRGVTKEAALLAIADYYDVDPLSTIAMGDGILNDGPMIEAAGCGVAMKNADEGILAIADLVTEKDNNEDGVGDFLKNLFGL